MEVGGVNHHAQGNGIPDKQLSALHDVLCSNDASMTSRLNSKSPSPPKNTSFRPGTK
jgi:hypothetical protein